MKILDLPSQALLEDIKMELTPAEHYIDEKEKFALRKLEFAIGRDIPRILKGPLGIENEEYFAQGYIITDAHVTSLALNHCARDRDLYVIGHFPRLQWLELCQNDLKCLPKLGRALPELRHLDLFCNNLDELPRDFSSLKAMTSLNLSDNDFVEIPRGISGMTRLQYLDLSDNCLLEVPEWITSLRQLKRLEIRGNPVKNGEYIRKLLQEQGCEVIA